MLSEKSCLLLIENICILVGVSCMAVLHFLHLSPRTSVKIHSQITNVGHRLAMCWGARCKCFFSFRTNPGPHWIGCCMCTKLVLHYMSTSFKNNNYYY